MSRTDGLLRAPFAAIRARAASDIIAINNGVEHGGMPVGQLIVRNVDESLIRALKIRAARKRRSAEAEHREILRDALTARRSRRTLKDLLREMPSGGDDADFERPRDMGRKDVL